MNNSDNNNNIWVEDADTIAKQKLINNQIKTICLVLVAIAIQHSYFSLHLFLTASSAYRERSSYVSLGSFAEGILILTGALFFYKKEKSGWVLLIFIGTYQIIYFLILIYQYIKILFLTTNSFYTLSIYSILLPSIVYGTMMYRLISEPIMTFFKASGKLLLTTVVIATMLCTTFIILNTFRGN